MRLLSFMLEGRSRSGIRFGEEVMPFHLMPCGDAALTMGKVLAMPSAERSALGIRAAGASGRVPLAGLTRLPPVPRPGKIICIGLNYAAHAKEGGNAIPDYPAIFLRGPTSLVAHGQPMLRPAASACLDYEGELAFVIGRPARLVAEAEALDHVAGYACFNEGTLRDFQRRSSQWTIGKNFDATGGFGPEIVTADELPAGAQGLRLRTRVNGETLQDTHTNDMIFDVARLVALLSEVMTLETGDVVATGTPSGVGYARKPPRWLTPGDVTEVEIEGIGVLSNPVADAAVLA